MRVNTKVQRYIFHLQLNVTRELTWNPRLHVGKALRQIALALTDVHMVDDAITWPLTLEAWWQKYGHISPMRRSWQVKDETVVIRGSTTVSETQRPSPGEYVFILSSRT
ncbi:MAG: family transposase [Microbacteriaceae bacterium]|nr:family transposase [Microbacteriaceae bacterium]HEV7951164.1 hypothetical protein [Glaciihabitans sp.]